MTSGHTLSQVNSTGHIQFIGDSIFVNSFGDLFPEELIPGVIIRHDSLVFDSDSITLRPTRQNALDELLVLLYSNDSLTIEIIGHTSMGAEDIDKYGDKYAHDIAANRARFVEDFLLENLISPTRITTSVSDRSRPHYISRSNRDKDLQRVYIRIVDN